MGQKCKEFDERLLRLKRQELREGIQDREWTGKGTTQDNKVSGKEQCYYTTQSLWKFLLFSK